MKIVIRLYSFLSTIAIAVVLFSCENDLESISRIVATDDSPTEITYDLKTVMTDSGKPNLMIEAAYAEKFSGEFPKTEFRDGIKLTFFNKQGEPESELTAEYGEITEKDGKMMVRDNVKFLNFAQKQELNTEELYWDRNQRKIFTDKMVTIKTKNGTYVGNHLTADESFKNYEMTRFSGEIVYSDTLNSK